MRPVAKIQVSNEFQKLLWEDLELTLKEFLENNKAKNIKKVKSDKEISIYSFEHPEVVRSGLYKMSIARGWKEFQLELVSK